MKSCHLPFAFFLATSLIISLPLFASGGDESILAREMVSMLSKGQFKEVISNFDSTMKKAAPEATLRMLWSSLKKQTGPLKEELNDTTITYKGYEIVTVTCSFRKSEQDFRIVFDKQSKIAGLFIGPHPGTAELLREVFDYIDGLRFVSHRPTPTDQMK